MGSPDVLLSARGLSRTVASRRLWQGVDLEVGTGERLTVAGPSGVGKSLLLRALAGLDALGGGTRHRADCRSHGDAAHAQ